MVGARGPAVLLVALVLAACGGPSTSDPTTVATTSPSDVRTGPLPDGLAFDVEIAQARTDRVARVVELRVHNAGDVDVVVTGARLTSAFVSGAAEAGREVRAGATRPLRVPLGEPVCDAGEDPRARVELDVTTAAGGAGTVVVAPTDETDDLRRVRGEDCAAAAVAAGLRLRLDDELALRDVDGQQVLDLRLRAEPVPGGPHVTVGAVHATTLLRPWGATGTWQVAVDSAAPPPDGVVVLPAVPARCDLHAIAEDKRGTVLGVQAVVDGVEQPVTYVAASDELRGAVYRAVRAACGTDDAG